MLQIHRSRSDSTKPCAGSECLEATCLYNHWHTSTHRLVSRKDFHSQPRAADIRKERCLWGLTCLRRSLTAFSCLPQLNLNVAAIFGRFGNTTQLLSYRTNKFVTCPQAWALFYQLFYRYSQQYLLLNTDHETKMHWQHCCSTLATNTATCCRYLGSAPVFTTTIVDNFEGAHACNPSCQNHFRADPPASSPPHHSVQIWSYSYP